MGQQFQYYAFVSYKREDENWAKWLQRKLESYKLPSVIRKASNDLPKRMHPVFRDKTDLKTGVLKDELRNELEQSQFLIVICSPLSATSHWVGREIDAFVDMGRSDRIIPLIIDGTPYSNNADTECFHPVMRERLPELLGVNIHEAGNESKYIKREKAFIRIISKMLNVSFDFLWRRQRRRMIRNAFIYSAVAILFILSVAFVWKANQPFNIELKIAESTPHNPNLPVKNGSITLFLGEESKQFKFNSVDTTFLFVNIPAKYKQTKAKFNFEVFGFYTIDTSLNLEHKMTLPIARNNTWGKLSGIVKNELGELIVGAIVRTKDISTTTDSTGRFILNIPIEEQHRTYQIYTSKDSYLSDTLTVNPLSEVFIQLKLN